MNNKWFLAAAVAALMISPAAMAQDDASKHGHYKEMMEKVDANQDGKVSKDEFIAAHVAKFEEMDADNDGFLSEEERKAAREAHRGQMKDKMKVWHEQKGEGYHNGHGDEAPE